MSYTLNYADKQEKFDEVVESNGKAGARAGVRWPCPRFASLG